MLSNLIVCLVTFLQLSASVGEWPCVPLYKCPTVLSDFKLRYEDPEYCDGAVELVECPEIEMSNSMKKCFEYSLNVFEESTSSEEEYNDRCKITAIPYIFGGIGAFPGEFPHMAAVGYKNKHGRSTLFCGGSLVSSAYVITTAYCVTVRNPNLVRIGTEDFTISDTVVHLNFELGRYYHDIALLKLNRKVKFNPNRRPICLPLPHTIISPDETLTAVGWSSDDQKILQKVDLEYYSYEECRDLYDHQEGLEAGVSSTTHLCYGDKKGRNKDTCAGDAGGPLLKHNDRVYCSYTLIGITSAGIGCQSNYPGLYTNVIPYLEWIESII